MSELSGISNLELWKLIDRQGKQIIELARQNVELVKGLEQLASSTSRITEILAGAALELEDPEGNHFLSINTRNALRALAGEVPESIQKVGGTF